MLNFISNAIGRLIREKIGFIRLHNVQSLQSTSFCYALSYCGEATPYTKHHQSIDNIITVVVIMPGRKRNWNTSARTPAGLFELYKNGSPEHATNSTDDDDGRGTRRTAENRDDQKTKRKKNRIPNPSFTVADHLSEELMMAKVFISHFFSTDPILTAQHSKNQKQNTHTHKMKNKPFCARARFRTPNIINSSGDLGTRKWLDMGGHFLLLNAALHSFLIFARAQNATKECERALVCVCVFFFHLSCYALCAM